MIVMLGVNRLLARVICASGGGHFANEYLLNNKFGNGYFCILYFLILKRELN